MMTSGSKTDGKGAAGPQFTNPQLVTPLADGILVGGLSIAVIVVVLLVGLVMPTAYDSFSTPDPSGSVTAADDGTSLSGMMRLDHLALIIILQTMINGPHFMGSYWMLYSTRGQIKRYPWSTIYMPILLVGMALLSVVLVAIGASMGQDAASFDTVFQQAQLDNPSGPASALLASFQQVPLFVGGRAISMLMYAATLIYLAWHYNGQAWGMTASYCYMAGIRLHNSDRQLIRSGFRAMTAVHVCWVLMGNSRMFASPDTAENITSLVVTLMVLSFAVTIPLGILGFRRAARRSGRRIPLRVILPWMAVYFWYLLIFIHPYFFVLLQLFHALQYLSFPFRVEANRHAARTDGHPGATWKRLLLLYLGLLAAGYLAFDLPPVLEMMERLAIKPFELAALVASVINIHHYFADGAIWKISNPDVRRDLFSHLIPRET